MTIAYNSASKHTQTLLLTLLAVPAAFGLAPARPDDKALFWGKAVDGFQMSISLESADRLPSGAPAIRLHFRNTGNAGGNVRLSLECDRPEGYRSDVLTLILKKSSGESERVADTALCSGRQSFFEVPIPVGAEYSMPLKFDYDRAITESGVARDFESPRGVNGTYLLQAVMTVDLGQELETLTSNDLILSGATSAGTDQGEPDWGAAANDLQMAISFGPITDTLSRLPAVTLHLRNVGAHDLRVVLGMGCAPTKGGLANGVILNLKDSSGSMKQLRNLGPGPPYPGGCGGGVWIFLVPMPSGAVYAVPLELEYYKTATFSAAIGDFESGWEPGGTYALQAMLKLRPEYMNPPPGATDKSFGESGAGTITSQSLEVRFPTR